MRCLRVRPHQPDFREPWTPPHGHYDPCARSSLYGVRQIGRAGNAASAARGKKEPQWSAERRASLIATGGGALRKRAGVCATPRGFAKPRDSRRFATPHIPGASRRGNERGCLRNAVA